jgi:hypothetical protein
MSSLVMKGRSTMGNADWFRVAALSVLCVAVLVLFAAPAVAQEEAAPQKIGVKG